MVVLPITLLEFAAVSTVETVELNWTTGSEINNAYFLLERSDGGHYVEELGVVSGQGSSHYNTDYQFVDEHPDRSLPYYRLTQVDYNGRSTSFDWVRVEGCSVRSEEHCFAWEPSMWIRYQRSNRDT